MADQPKLQRRRTHRARHRCRQDGADTDRLRATAALVAARRNGGEAAEVFDRAAYDQRIHALRDHVHVTRLRGMARFVLVNAVIARSDDIDASLRFYYTMAVLIDSLADERGIAWLEVAREIIPAHRRAEIAEHLEALRELGPIPAVPCHLDFIPSNLLRDRHGCMRLIDFEHTRYDLAARDLVRLATRTWAGRPDLEDAFLSTYGTLTDLDRHVITHARHLDDLTRTARNHGLSARTDVTGDEVLA